MDTFLFFRRFRVNVVLRLVSIGATMLASIVFFLQFDNYVWLLAGGLILTLQTRSLLFRIERITRDLTSFLEAIQYSDFTQSFRTPFSERVFRNLYDAFAEVMRSFQDTRSESEAQRRYFETIVHHIGIGLLCYHPNGRVRLINAAAKRLLDIPALLNIQDLETFSPRLVEALKEVGSGDQRLIQVQTGSERLQISVYATRFTLHNEAYVLVSLQNIGSQLEDSEMDAMQHMTRVLAHEIMNSMTPIISLASLAQEHLNEHAADSATDPDTIEDLQDALQTIEKRSEGLVHFVNAYRSIARIPKPEFQLCPVRDLFVRVQTLFEAQLKSLHVRFEHHIEPASLSVLADPDLIEQILINLVKNAIEALDGLDNKSIYLEGLLDRQGRVMLKVTDNGPGIPDEIMENIFVPFFSTKSDGSGIGLSFSRQVMRRHRGILLVHTHPGGPTTFTLRF